MNDYWPKYYFNTKGARNSIDVVDHGYDHGIICHIIWAFRRFLNRLWGGHFTSMVEAADSSILVLSYSIEVKLKIIKIVALIKLTYLHLTHLLSSKWNIL